MAGIRKGGELVSAPHVLVHQYSPFLHQIHAMQAMTDLFFTPKYQILNNSYLKGRQYLAGFYFLDFNR